MARLQTVSRQFTIAADKVVGDIRAAHVALAKREHNKVMRTDPRPVVFTRIVDGHVGAAEDTVSKGGIIVYRYPRLSEVVAFAMQALFDASPVDSGEYRSSHTLFVNGAPASNLSNWRPGDEIVIANPLPYSRKIERGAMTMRVAGTDHVYDRVERKVARRFHNVASVDYTYRSIYAGAVMPYLHGERTREGRKRLKKQPARLSAMRMERESRVPCIIIQER